MIGFHRQHLHSFQKRTHHPPPPKHTFFFFGGGVCLVPSTSRSLAERSSTVCACLPWVFYFKKQQPQQQSIFTNSYSICIDCINKQTDKHSVRIPHNYVLCVDQPPALPQLLRKTTIRHYLLISAGTDRLVLQGKRPTDRPTADRHHDCLQQKL